MGPVSQKIVSPLVILSMEKTMVTMVISELKSISRLKIFRETEPWSFKAAFRKAPFNALHSMSGFHFLYYVVH